MFYTVRFILPTAIVTCQLAMPLREMATVGVPEVMLAGNTKLNWLGVDHSFDYLQKDVCQKNGRLSF
jgi:hypothetical protein